MFKKLISIFLCLTMFAMPMLVSCGTDAEGVETGDDATEEETRLPMTLTLWLPTDESTTEDAIKLVEEELNKLTQSKYDTAIQLNAISSDEYQEVIDARIKEIDDVQKAAESAAESERLQAIENAINGVRPTEGEEAVVAEETVDETAEETVETELNEYGQAVTVYPDVEDDQLDIFLVKGYDNYLNYIEEELIEALDTDINSVGKKLYSYIYPTFMDLAKVEGSTYGIPNNHALGEYQFLLVNKRLVEEYDYDPEALDSFVDCGDFITDIGNQNLLGVTPLLGEVEPANMVYFSNDGNWSIIGAQIGSGVMYNSELEPTNVFQSTDFRATYVLNKKLKAAGYVGDGVIDEGEEFAVGIVSGDASLRDVYSDDYYVYIHAVPVGDVDGVLESAFCVSTYTKSTSRSMEIITYLNTDETVRTLLQYGVEDLHWEEQTANGEKVLAVLKDTYKMDIIDTGNVYLTYPAPGVPMSYWEYAKTQNLDSSTNPFVGFEYITEDNSSFFDKLAVKSADVWAKLEAASASEIQSLASSLVGETIKDSVVSALMLEEGNEDIGEPILYLYKEVYFKNKR